LEAGWEVFKSFVCQYPTFSHMRRRLAHFSFYAGRFRSQQQCRDRYFNVVMPREEGRGSGSASTSPQPGDKRPKKKKAKKDQALPAGGAQPTTTALMEKDRRTSLIEFHSNVFLSIARASQSRGGLPAAPPPQGATSPQMGMPAQSAPTTPGGPNSVVASPAGRPMAPHEQPQAAQSPSSAVPIPRLVQHILTQFSNERANRLAQTIAANLTASEEDKVRAIARMSGLVALLLPLFSTFGRHQCPDFVFLFCSHSFCRVLIFFFSLFPAQRTQLKKIILQLQKASRGAGGGGAAPGTGGQQP
jgi:hypothetical protein